MAVSFTDGRTYGVDFAHTGLDQDKLETFLADIRQQPTWRWEADREVDYYDGNQLEGDVVAEMAERGLPPIITNLVRPAIDTVIGMETKGRTDWRVVGEFGDKDSDLAQAMTVKLKKHERLSKVDRAISEAFEAEAKVGMGWVEVARESDPFKAPYRVKYVHRREIWWDWRAKEADLSDARFLVRRQWMDEDQLIVMFPKYKELIEHTLSGWNGWDANLLEHTTGVANSDTLLMREWGIERDTTIEEMEWRDTDRRRLTLFEVWYRVWERGIVMKLQDGRAIEFDENNPRHMDVVAAGKVELFNTVYSKMRLSWWLGPHRLVDIPSPYKHSKFPYVPFWGYREDRTGIPYGLIRSMKSPQDEFNARRMKMLWLLSAKRTMIDEDALSDNDHDAAMLEIGRPDAYIKLNPHRTNKDAIKVESDFGMAAQQFQVMLDAKQNIQDAGGIFRSAMGNLEQTAHAPTSGVALHSLIEQSTTTLAKIYDNLRLGREMVGNLMLDLILQDIGTKPLTIKVGVDAGQEKEVVLNEVQTNAFGVRYRANDTTQLRSKVVLNDVPSTPSYRAQQSYLLTELTKSLPPEIQALVVDMVIEATDISNRHEIADRIRRATGIAPANTKRMSPEQIAQMKVEAKRKAEVEALQKRGAIAKVALDEVTAEKIKADIDAPERRQRIDQEGRQTDESLKAQIKEEEDRRQHEFDMQKTIIDLAAEKRLQEMKDQATIIRQMIHEDSSKEIEKLRAEVQLLVAQMKDKPAEQKPKETGVK